MNELTAWLRALDEARAETVLEVPGGVAVRHSAYPRAHDHNKLIVSSPCDPSELADAAEQVLQDVSHRRIEALAGGDDLAEVLASRGYVRENGLLMELFGPAPRSSIVQALSLEDRVAAGTADWQAEQPSWDVETCRQLGERIVTVAPWATFLGVPEDESFVARADLFVRDGIAQVEGVLTRPQYQGRGYASALVLDAAARAEGSRVFLHADADDWPKELYAKLGFVEVGRIVAFSRTAGPSGVHE
ncbi:MAG: hypothetical protein JWO12_2404 [Frankiales bacterium]|nr:hypothetical protein [Frankiales bacterium]